MILSDLRTQHDLTQEDIVKRIGIPYNTYRHYEYGDTFPKKDALIALAKLYGMSPGQLLDLLLGWKE